MDKYNEAFSRLKLSHPRVAELVEASLKADAAKGK
jgi:hypothetical protein